MITFLDDAQTVKGHIEEDLAEEILFFHGKESGPFGTKFKALSEAFPAATSSPDFQGMDLEARLAKAEEATRGKTGLIIVGSSMGGLVAALLADKHPERIFGLILVAPAVTWSEADRVQKLPTHTEVIAGRDDEIIPLEAIEAFTRKHFLPLTITGDSHRMHKSLGDIVEATTLMVEARSKT